MNGKFRTTSVEQTESLAAKLAVTLRPGNIVAFRGGLGAGKTAFVRGLAAGLGIHKADVSSPTFTLVHEYRGAGGATLYHFDMYRITDPDSLESTGFYDYLDAGGILAVEWSEQIDWAIPSEAIIVEIAVLDGDNRHINITGNITRGEPS